MSNENLKKRKRNKKTRLKVNAVKLLALCVSILLCIIATKMIVNDELSNFILYAAITLIGIFIVLDMINNGVDLRSFNTEVIIGFSVIALLVQKRVLEAYCAGALYLTVEIIVSFCLKRIDSEGKKLGLNFRSYEKPWRGIKTKYFIVLIVAVALTITLSVSVLRLETREIIYRTVLVIVTLSTFLMEKGFPMIEYATVINLAKDGVYISDISNMYSFNGAEALVLEKNNILTTGEYRIHQITPYFDYTKEELIEIVAYGEYYSNHPLSKAFQAIYGNKILDEYISNYKEMDGKGVSFSLADEEYIIGNCALISQHGFKPFEADNQPFTIYIMKEGILIGSIELLEDMQIDVFNTVERLRNAGVERIAFISADNENYSRRTAGFAGIEEVYANLNNEGKLNIVSGITKDEKGKCIYMTSDDDDTLLLETADIGIAIGDRVTDKTDADVIIPNGGLEKVERSIRLSHNSVRTMKIFKYFGITMRAIMVALSILGVLNIIEISAANAVLSILFIILCYRTMNVRVI